MKHLIYMTRLVLIFTAILMVSCSLDEEQYVAVPNMESPVVADLSQVPYPKLSDYKLFEGEMKSQIPAYGLIPYQPASGLFTDYAEKKRFVWLPKNTKATYNGDGNPLQLPIGAVLVKTFYYNHVQPGNATRLVETRLMIRKTTGWIFAEYKWNEEQTEAFLQDGGSTIDITWTAANNVQKSVNYRIPSEAECFTCHNINEEAFPIGIKPQNINTNYNYPEGSKNQLAKLIEFGYLDDDFPANIVSVVDFNDTTRPLDLRVRSYFDSNCAHCHRDGGHAEFYALRFQFGLTENLTNMGVCVTPNHQMAGFEGRIVAPGNIDESMLYVRMLTNDFDYRMPLLGRTIRHEEALQLVEQWINSITDCP